MLSGFFGVGDGFVIVPALVVVLGFPARKALSTSLLIIALISVGGIVGHLQAVQVDWLLTGILLLDGALGMTGGLWIARRASSATLTRSYAAVAFVVAIVMIVHNGLKLFSGV